MSETPTHTHIFKVFRPAGWDRLNRDGTTVGSALDQTDGYIHFSTKPQLQGTLDKHYVEAGEVILAEIAIRSLPSAALKWEAARGGALFPHLYAPLPLASVIRHWRLRPDGNGRYELPDLSPNLL